MTLATIYIISYSLYFTLYVVIMAIDTFEGGLQGNSPKYEKNPKRRINSSVEAYKKPIVSLLGYELFPEDYDKFKEWDTVENLINRFVGDNSENQKCLTEWFNYRGYNGGDELTIYSFMEELDNYRRELDDYDVDTWWIDWIVSWDKKLRLCSLSEEGKERLKECYKFYELVDLFVENKGKDTVRRWFKHENCWDETEMTVEFLVRHFCKIKDRLIENKKKHLMDW